MRILFIIFLFISSNSFGQTFKEQFEKRFFHIKGIEFDLSLYPYNEEQYDNVTFSNQWETFGFNYLHSFRFNILELDDSQAFSISFVPALGINFGMNRQRISFDTPFFRDVFGVGSINLPIELSYHFGSWATKNAKEKFGLSLSVGKEFRIAPLFSWADEEIYKRGLEKFYSGFSLKAAISRNKKTHFNAYVKTLFFDLQRRTYGYGNPYYSTTFILGINFFPKKE